MTTELFKFQAEVWNIITPENDPPPPRRDHRAWVQGDNMLVYGGLGQSGSSPGAKAEMEKIGGFPVDLKATDN